MPAAGDPPLLDVEITRKTLSRGAVRLEIIDGMRFALARGAVTCLLGPSGCGKTTALRIVTGLDRDYEGALSPPIDTLRLGVVFQEPRLLPWRTVEQNVALAAPGVGAATVETLLDEVGLLEWRRHRPNQISGGMARRVALARALVVNPDLLILDEAFVSLDERNADVLRDVVFSAVARRKTTVLMVTHNVREALLFSDTLLVLAPRPTRVTSTVDLPTARGERTQQWLDNERIRLLNTADQTFFSID